MADVGVIEQTGIDAGKLDVVPVQINTDAIIHALKTDPEFFIQFFLGDELTHKVPEFHIDVLSKMWSSDVDKFCCAIPRDHAKTTLAKLACIYYFLFSHYRFIVYLSNTSSISVPYTNDIIAFMETDNFKAIFGPLEFYIKRDGDGLYKFKLQDKICILRAMGSGQQVRGINVDNKRPQLAIIDDLEDATNIATPQLFLKLKRWLYGQFRKALDKFDNKMIWLGNMITNKSMLYENCNSPYWYSLLYGVLLDDGTALWPDAWSLEALKADYQEYAEAGMADIWFAEMMNQPVTGAMIPASDIPYKPQVFPDDVEYSFITVDLAISEQELAHKTVVVVHSWVETEEQCFWQITEAFGQQGMDPVYLFDIIISLCRKWHVQAVGIENVAFQASLKYIYKHFCLQRGISGVEFLPLYTGRSSKYIRMQPWIAMLKHEEYCLTEGDFDITQQLLAFNPERKNNDDDFIDGCAYGPQMIQNYMHLISTPMIDLHTANNTGVVDSYAVSDV